METKIRTEEIVTLSNGLRVANFSSPHEFKFTDGSVLPARSPEEAEAWKVNFHEEVDEDGDIKLSFSLSQDVYDQIFHWESMREEGLVDYVFCPLPMITALKESGFNIKSSPFRSVRIEDRINKLVSIDKRCI